LNSRGGVIQRVLLVASKTGYQVAEFFGAAERLGVELVLATDRCHILDDPYGDRATPLRFEAAPEERDIEALRARGPFDGVLAVGDRPAFIAACCAERLGIRFHPSDSVAAANDKFETRERFRAAGLNVPDYQLLRLDGSRAPRRFPCVLKPLHFSASRGVIRANAPAEFAAAEARIRKMTGADEPLLVEDFIPGREFALDGLITEGKLQTLAIFDKPDPLDGPFFEETIYLTPSREPTEVQQAIQDAVERAVSALGLRHGPVHAEMRVNHNGADTPLHVNPCGVWMLEVAARPIGGLCSRVLRFEDDAGLEEILLRHAIGRDVLQTRLAPGAHGVKMIPIPREGVYSGVDGLQDARASADIEAIEITAKKGQYLETLPEGASYLGFLFARAPDAERVEQALRRAHSSMKFRIEPALRVVR
jgi:biotin carboxylase